MTENNSCPSPLLVKRQTGPLSAVAELGVAAFETYLRDSQDLSAGTLRAYSADLRAFAVWCEIQWAGPGGGHFAPDQLTTPLLTRHRAHLQTGVHLKPASVNRALAALKRYCRWAQQAGLAPRDPARTVRFVRLEPAAPRGLSDLEEDALVRAVHKHGSLRDQTLVTLLLHTGLRASEVCALQQRDLTLDRRSGTLTVTGKGHKGRDVPLNITARQALTRYLSTIQPDSPFLFPSDRREAALSIRALDHLIRKYTQYSRLDVSLHELRHRFGSVMADRVPLHRLAQIMGHDSLDPTARYTRATPRDLQAEVEKIAWRSAPPEDLYA